MDRTLKTFKHNHMKEKNDVWEVTIKCSVFAGDMSRDEVIATAQKQLENLFDGSDFIGVSVEDAKRDE